MVYNQFILTPLGRKNKQPWRFIVNGLSPPLPPSPTPSWGWLVPIVFSSWQKCHSNGKRIRGSLVQDICLDRLSNRNNTMIQICIFLILNSKKSPRGNISDLDAIFCSIQNLNFPVLSTSQDIEKSFNRFCDHLSSIVKQYRLLL